jgi:hypothetical protein
MTNFQERVHSTHNNSQDGPNWKDFGHKSSCSANVISLQAYRLEAELRKRLAKIAEARTTIAEAEELFDGTQEIRPVECDQVTESLQLLKREIKSLLGIFDAATSARLFKRDHTLRVHSYYVEQQIGELTSHMAIFRTVCLETTREAFAQQLAICKRIKSLSKSGIDVEREGEGLLGLVSE